MLKRVDTGGVVPLREHIAAAVRRDVVIISAAARRVKTTSSSARGRLRVAREAQITSGIVANSVTVASCEYMAAAAQPALAHDAQPTSCRCAAVRAKCSAAKYHIAANAVVTAQIQRTASTYDGMTAQVSAAMSARSRRLNTRAVRCSSRTLLMMWRRSSSE